MKKVLLILLLSVFALTSKSQVQNCQFTYSQAGAISAFQFTPNYIWPSPQFTYLWDFGDGTTSTVPAPFHNFNSTGPFNVCCNVLDSAGVVCTFCATITGAGNSCLITFTVDSITGVATFVNNSQGSGISTWDFGDNSPVTIGTVVSHTYISPGVYTACVTERDSATGSVLCTSCVSVGIGQNTSLCNFTYTASPAQNNTILFTAGNNNSVSYFWDYGDGSTGAGGPVNTHVYSQAGIYTACLTTIDFFGDTCNFCTAVNVSPNTGTCSFVYFPDPQNQGVISFIANPGLPSSTITWSFGDGTSGTGTNASHTYASAGSYTVCMNELDSNGTILCSYCDVIPVTGSGNCTFTTSIDSLQANLAYFNFTPNSSSSQVTWDFGDGSFGTGASISHFYPGPGSYLVCVTETDQPSGVTLCHTCLNVSVNFIPTCSFTAVADSANPNMLTLTASVGAGSAITWSFGDGTAGTGSPVQHVFAQAGIYHICVNEVDTATSAILCVSCQDIFVGVANPACRANFVATSLGLTGYFIDLSTGTSPLTSYTWDFGDNTTSTSRFPQHVYNSPGTYTACLTIADNSCTDTYCSTIVVDTAIGNPGACQAYFITLQLAPYQVAVVNLSNGLNLSFNWDFGDGSTSNVPYPSHFYNSIGSYNLCLTVADSSGCTSTYCDSVSVDSLGNIFRGMNGFTVNVLSPAQLTGVSDSPKSAPFSVYPNPVQEELTIALPASVSGRVNYRIFSLQGAEIAGGSMTTGTARLNTEKWNSGVYLLEITDDAGYKSYRQIIKQ
ncbi:MAG TPA: PKD domain-containing protein [Bacteroidia bacterium]|nr:PKD domain-containing protein [Bacteroidia bacterium]